MIKEPERFIQKTRVGFLFTCSALACTVASSIFLIYIFTQLASNSTTESRNEQISEDVKDNGKFVYAVVLGVLVNLVFGGHLANILWFQKIVYKFKRIEAVPFVMYCFVSVVAMIMGAVNLKGLPFYYLIPFLVSLALTATLSISLFLRKNKTIRLFLHPYLSIKLPVSIDNHQTASTDDKLTCINPISVQMITDPAGNKDNNQKDKVVIKSWPNPDPFPVKTLYPYQASESQELSFSSSQLLTVTECNGKWWRAECQETGKSGYIPSNYVEVVKKALVVGDDEGNGILSGQVIEVIEWHVGSSLIRTSTGEVKAIASSYLQLV